MRTQRALSIGVICLVTASCGAPRAAMNDGSKGSDRAMLERYGDAPTAAPPPRAGQARFATWEEALRGWRGIDDVNAWIGERFRYDTARARELSETRREDGVAPSIYEPAAFFEAPRGVCVDLARFAFETVERVAPEMQPKYLMVEFEPVEVQGVVLRRHWLVTFVRDGKLYAFADSKRPGQIAGPYDSLDALRASYQLFRQRPIVSVKQLDSFKKKQVRVSRPPATDG